MKQQLDTRYASLRQACHSACPGYCTVSSKAVGKTSMSLINANIHFHTHTLCKMRRILAPLGCSPKCSSEHHNRHFTLQITAKYSTLIIWLDHIRSTRVFKTSTYSSCGIYCLHPHKTVTQSRMILDSTACRLVLQHDPQHVFGLSKPAPSQTISQARFSSLHKPGTLLNEQSTCSHPILEPESV